MLQPSRMWWHCVYISTRQPTCSGGNECRLPVGCVSMKDVVVENIIGVEMSCDRFLIGLVVCSLEQGWRIHRGTHPNTSSWVCVGIGLPEYPCFLCHCMCPLFDVCLSSASFVTLSRCPPVCFYNVFYAALVVCLCASEASLSMAGFRMFTMVFSKMFG